MFLHASAYASNQRAERSPGFPGVTLLSTVRGNAFLRRVRPFYSVAGYRTSFTLGKTVKKYMILKSNRIGVRSIGIVATNTNGHHVSAVVIRTAGTGA